MLTGKNLIGYKLYGMGSSTFSAAIHFKNVMGTYTFHEATASEIDRAVMLAAKAFDVYRKTDAMQKLFFLNHWPKQLALKKTIWLLSRCRKQN